MTTFPEDKYKYFTTSNKVIAISTYAGRTVRGVAKCDPRDPFDMEKGRQLAAARCSMKIATKRAARARKKMNEANAARRNAVAHCERMSNYLHDSEYAVVQATEHLDRVLHNM